MTLDEARIDALDKRACQIEDRLYGDGNIDRERRAQLRADLRAVYDEMGVVINRLGAALKAGSR